jgi:hypothetical protein
MACTKKTKKYSVRNRVVASKFVFFIGDTYFFNENLCTNIKCLDVHAKFYFGIFGHFKMYFHTIGSYAPMSQIAFPSPCGAIICARLCLSRR